MGEVWLARDLRLARTVALKVLPTELTRDEDRVARFHQEARTTSALNHPNVCTIHALGATTEGQQFIVMEHIAGDSLRQRLAGGVLPLREVLDVGVQVASALSTAHAAGIVHRDVKPENVMLRPDGLVKVVDFGLAKLAPLPIGAADATVIGARTEAGMVLGTVAYMSPEQARGLEVDARTDIWALGVMLYEMITGRPAFSGQTTSDLDRRDSGARAGAAREIRAGRAERAAAHCHQGSAEGSRTALPTDEGDVAGPPGPTRSHRDAGRKARCRARSERSNGERPLRSRTLRVLRRSRVPLAKKPGRHRQNEELYGSVSPAVSRSSVREHGGGRAPI